MTQKIISYPEQNNSPRTFRIRFHPRRGRDITFEAPNGGNFSAVDWEEFLAALFKEIAEVKGHPALYQAIGNALAKESEDSA